MSRTARSLMSAALLVPALAAAQVPTIENLTQIDIAGAGHMVPSNQPAAARDMIYHWIRGEALPISDPLSSSSKK